MPPKILTNGPELTDEQVDSATVQLPPLPDNMLALLRNLQQQVTDLTARVEALEQ